MKIKLLKEWEAHEADTILTCGDEESQAQAKSLISLGMAVEWTEEDEAKVKATSIANETQAKALQVIVANEIRTALKANATNGIHVPITITRDEGEEGFKNLGEQMIAIRKHTDPSCEIDKLSLKKLEISRTKASQGMNERIDQDGGWAVQTDFLSSLYDIGTSSGEFSGRASSINSTSNANAVCWNEVLNYDRTAGQHYGGINVYRTEEAGSYTKSKPKINRREIKLNKLTGLYYATDELNEDGGALTGFVQGWFGEEFAFQLDSEMWDGNGAGKCEGITVSDCFISQAKVTSQTAATFNVTNALQMKSRLDKRCKNAAWFMNNDVTPQLPLMTIGDQPVYVANVNGAPNGTLLGLPIVISEHCATLGTANDVVLGDFSKYLLLKKGGLTSDSSIHVQFLTGEMTYRFQMRVNGQPAWSTYRTPLNGSTTTSPFVGLAVRS